MTFWDKFIKWLSGGVVGDAINGANLTGYTKAEDGSPLMSFINQYTHHTLSGEQIALNDMSKSNVVEQPSLEVQGYKNAGVNPALMYGSGVGSAPTAPQQMTAGSAIQDMATLISLPTQLEQMRQNIELTKQNVENRQLDNEFAKRTMNARVLSEDLKNNLTEQQIAQIEDNRKLIIQNLAKVIEETKNEQEKRLLIQAQTALETAKANEIAALLPYNQLLLEAQTENQKASAAASWVAAAYQQKLIDSGYVEAMCNQMYASAAQMYTGAELNRANMQITEFKNSVQDGTFFNEDKKVFSGKTLLGKVANYHANLPAKAMNFVFRCASGVAQAVGGPLSGLLPKN